jgi:hypothetical protein
MLSGAESDHGTANLVDVVSHGEQIHARPMRRCPILAVLVLSACGGRMSIEQGGGAETGETGETGDPWAGHHELWTLDHFYLDILFVIDDSLSMSTVQYKLIELAPIFVGLDQLSCNGGRPYWTSFDYRVAFTTTDNGNPWCTSSPEAGGLVLQPCFEHLDEFVVGDVDVRDEACLAPCGLDAAGLERLATPVDGDDVPRVRPWIERIDGVSNLPVGTDVRDAIACLLPQGIAGCEFDAPLESMRLALERAVTPGDQNFGFLRDDADLLVVILTDSYDCSLAPGGEGIFDPDGEKVFWSDPDAESPTQAVCFNAGMQCIENPDGWDACEPADRGLSGDAVEADAAVLHPVERYLDFLQALEQDKQAHGASVTVAIAAGFTEHGDVHYEMTSEPEWHDQYAIGPGCTAPPFGAQPLVEVPPAARLSEVTEAFGHGVSLCDADIGMVLDTPFSHTCPGWEPPCYPGCVLDGDPQTPVLDPECEVAAHVPGEGATPIVECMRGLDGAYLIDPEQQSYKIPAGEDFCAAMVGDTNGETPDPFDDLNSSCSDEGVNLQVLIVNRPGMWVIDGTRFTASCTESTQPEIDCPAD